MKKIVLFSLFSAISLLAQSSGGYNGYTYFSVGVENITYKESFFSNTLGANVNSVAKASSPVYISGGLMRVNDTFDFSMDIASTLLPTTSDEEWSVGGALAQKNSFDAMISSMEFLGHYKLTDNHRAVAGLAYKLDSYKRYDFRDPAGDPLDPEEGLSEERVATLYLTTGYWYESIPQATPGQVRFKASATVGLPVWNQATNTSFKKITFNSTNGYKANANLYAGYPVLDGVELGLFCGYNFQKKSGTDVASDGHTKWPENELEIWQGGISAVWNFSNK